MGNFSSKRRKIIEKWTLHLLNILEHRLEMIHLQILFEILHPSLSEGRGGEGVTEWVDCRVDIHEAIGVIPQGPGNYLYKA